MRRTRRANLTAKLQRKDPRLPVFVVIPAKVVSSWKLTGTTVVEGTANGYSFGRRTIKAWGKGVDSWFIEFTAPICKAAGLEVGKPVDLEFQVADTATPREIEVLLSASTALSRAWAGLSDRERREACENVRAGKSAATRQRRAEAVVGALGS